MSRLFDDEALASECSSDENEEEEDENEFIGFVKPDEDGLSDSEELESLNNEEIPESQLYISNEDWQSQEQQSSEKEIEAECLSEKEEPIRRKRKTQQKSYVHESKNKILKLESKESITKKKPSISFARKKAIAKIIAQSRACRQEF